MDGERIALAMKKEEIDTEIKSLLKIKFPETLLPLFENVDFPDSLGFECKRCGQCCRDFPADVNSKERKHIEERGFKDFLQLPDPNPFPFIIRKEEGCCLFLTNENTCEIHDVKPNSCILQPFTIVDYDYHNNLIFVDLALGPECPGVATIGKLPYTKMAKAAQEQIKDLIEVWSKKMKLPISDSRVYAKVRFQILRSLM